MQAVVELTVGLKTIRTATYAVQRSGIVFKRVLIFQSIVSVATDRLLVSEEAVRVLDTRE